MIQPFHLAVTVKDIPKARRFYGEIMGFEEGRSAERWVDFNMYGHQFVIHLDENKTNQSIAENPVDEHAVPVPHFGIVLEQKDWDELAVKMKAVGTDFIIEPYLRFEGQPGEQSTMFFLDPSGNALEFKAFKNPDMLFAK